MGPVRAFLQYWGTSLGPLFFFPLLRTDGWTGDLLRFVVAVHNRRWPVWLDSSLHITPWCNTLQRFTYVNYLRIPWRTWTFQNSKYEFFKSLNFTQFPNQVKLTIRTRWMKSLLIIYFPSYASACASVGLKLQRDYLRIYTLKPFPQRIQFSGHSSILGMYKFSIAINYLGIQPPRIFLYTEAVDYRNLMSG